MLSYQQIIHKLASGFSICLFRVAFRVKARDLFPSPQSFYSTQPLLPLPPLPGCWLLIHSGLMRHPALPRRRHAARSAHRIHLREPARCRCSLPLDAALNIERKFMSRRMQPEGQPVGQCRTLESRSPSRTAGACPVSVVCAHSLHRVACVPGAHQSDDHRILREPLRCCGREAARRGLGQPLHRRLAREFRSGLWSLAVCSSSSAG